MAERLLSEMTPALLRPGGLQDLAAAALERTLAADPDDAHALWKLAEIHRRRGDFAAARGLYRRLRTRGPDRRKAAWLHRVLGGDGPPEAAPGGVWPAPFVWMTDFLAPGECDRLLALGTARRECFTPAKVGDPSATRVDPEVRMTLEADARTMQESRPRIGPKIRSVLPDVLARLGMPGLDRYRIEMGMRVYLGGGFYRAHSDNRSMGYRPRVLSFVYFFHREPRRFSGGGSPALRHGRRYVRLDLRGVLPDRSAGQQHRVLSQRLLAPGVLRAVRDGRLRGWTLGRERPCVAARGRGRGRGVSSR